MVNGPGTSFLTTAGIPSLGTYCSNHDTWFSPNSDEYVDEGKSVQSIHFLMVNLKAECAK